MGGYIYHSNIYRDKDFLIKLIFYTDRNIIKKQLIYYNKILN